MSFEQILKEKYGLELPEPSQPAGLYTPVVQVDQLVYVSGQTPRREGKRLFVGVVGRDFTVEQGQEAARAAMLNCLAQLKAYLGDLAKIKQFVQVTGYVRCSEGFGDQPNVMNGASALLIDLFGEAGKHTRLALGANELPGGAAVEITCIVAIKKQSS